MKRIAIAAALAAVPFLSGCHSVEPLETHAYESRPQNVRAIKRLHTEDVAVAEVRLVSNPDLECAGRIIPIPGMEYSAQADRAVANYWKKALESDLDAAGVLNEKTPKVRLYNLIESVKILAEPTRLRWTFTMRVFSSNGKYMDSTATYNVPTDNMPNMQEACSRLAKDFDKAVAWSLLKTISAPEMTQLVQPGLGFVPVMKATSLTKSLSSIIRPEDDEPMWKEEPKKPVPANP
jgi:hypothetical protein